MKKQLSLSYHPLRQLLFILSLGCLAAVGCKEHNKPGNPGKQSFPLEGLTIEALQAKLAAGDLTAYEVTRLYLERIAQLDDRGPELNAIIELNPDALSTAVERDKERANHQVRGLLHGIPILLKDNIDTGDKMETTAGSLALAGHHAAADAFIVSRLREAGAIILGKTNMTEWANFRSPNAISGWSSRGGQTKNPYNLSASPCGSSSGSAVAVAADLCMIAVGTSTNGSIACPSSFNGVVGIRPTLGLLSRSGIIPLAKSQDTPGPIARTVRDAVILLEAMTGRDPNDPVTLGCPSYDPGFLLAALDTASLRGRRIGIDKAIISETAGMGEVLQRAIAVMKNHGATIVEVDFIPHYNSIRDSEFTLMAYEFKDGVNQYLAASNGRVKSLEELIHYNQRNESAVMPYFNQEFIELAHTKGSLDSREYRQAVTQVQQLRIHLNQLMQTHNLDALAGIGYGAYSPSAVTGFPSVTLPTGTFSGLPVGITFIGKPWNEASLLAIAYAYESKTSARIPPRYLPGSATP